MRKKVSITAVNDGKFEYKTKKAAIYIIITVVLFLLFIPSPWSET